MTGLFPFMVYNEEKKPAPKQIIKKLARFGIKDLTIRTIERDIKEVKKLVPSLKNIKSTPANGGSTFNNLKDITSIFHED